MCENPCVCMYLLGVAGQQLLDGAMRNGRTSVFRSHTDRLLCNKKLGKNVWAEYRFSKS